MAIYNCIWSGWFHHFDIGNSTPKMWSKPDATDEEMNAKIREMKAKESPLFTKVSRRFKDPTGQNREALVLPIDSTKLETEKSKDFHKQKSTHFKNSRFLGCH